MPSACNAKFWFDKKIIVGLFQEMDKLEENKIFYIFIENGWKKFSPKFRAKYVRFEQ